MKIYSVSILILYFSRHIIWKEITMAFFYIIINVLEVNFSYDKDKNN